MLLFSSSFALASLLLGLAASISSAQTPSSGKAGAAESEVRRLSDEEVQGFLNRDPAVFDRLWSADFVVTNPLNKFVTKPQVLDMVRSGFLVIASYERRIEYAKVYGDTVILAGAEAVTWGGRMPNAGKSEQLRFTAVWMKQRSRWQEVARHANIIPQP